MKRINSIFYFLLIILLITIITIAFTSLSAIAQNQMTVSHSRHEIKDNLVQIELLINMNNVKVSNRAFVLLTPSLQQGNIAVDFPAVMINGKNRHKAYRRLVAMNRQPKGLGKVIDAGAKGAPRLYNYSTSIPYEPWMNDAEIVIKEEQCNCNGQLVNTNIEPLASREEMNVPVSTIYKDVQLNFVVSFKEPSPEPVKIRSESGKAYLDYAAGKADLNFDYKNNAAELAKIGNMIQKIKNNPATTITRIIIDGYSSPEGIYSANMILSAKRATALKNYLGIMYDLKEDFFRITGQGEDWNTLIELLEDSDKDYKGLALQIIHSTNALDARERRLAELRGGAPFRDMLVNFFPQLRRSNYELQYSVIPFTIEEGKETLETNPALLSLNEMFLIAQSYPVGSAEFQRVFDIAAKTYTNNDVANFNVAANALAAHNVDAAQQYMNQVANRNAAFDNNMGVLAAMQEEYDKSIEYFTSAKARGSVEAVKNLAEIGKLKEAHQ